MMTTPRKSGRSGGCGKTPASSPRTSHEQAVVLHSPAPVPGDSPDRKMTRLEEASSSRETALAGSSSHFTALENCAQTSEAVRSIEAASAVSSNDVKAVANPVKALEEFNPWPLKLDLHVEHDAVKPEVLQVLGAGQNRAASFAKKRLSQGPAVPPLQLMAKAVAEVLCSAVPEGIWLTLEIPVASSLTFTVLICRGNKICLLVNGRWVTYDLSGTPAKSEPNTPSPTGQVDLTSATAAAFLKDISQQPLHQVPPGGNMKDVAVTFNTKAEVLQGQIGRLLAEHDQRCVATLDTLSASSSRVMSLAVATSHWLQGTHNSELLQRLGAALCGEFPSSSRVEQLQLQSYARRLGLPDLALHALLEEEDVFSVLACQTYLDEITRIVGHLSSGNHDGMALIEHCASLHEHALRCLQKVFSPVLCEKLAAAAAAFGVSVGHLGLSNFESWLSSFLARIPQ